MSDDDDIHVPGLPRKRVAKKPTAPSVAVSSDKSEARAPSGTNIATVLMTSTVTSVLVSAAVVFALARVRPSMLASSAGALSSTSATGASAAAEVVVPDLARIPAESVRAIVEAMGLRAIVNERREPSAITAGLVAAQAPRAGTRVARGGDVAVVISSGPAQSAAQPTPQPVAAQPAAGTQATQAAEGLVVVPSVGRMYEGAARARLSGAGLVLGAHRRGGYDEDVAPGRILRQSPAAGARVARGTSIDVWVNEE